MRPRITIAAWTLTLAGVLSAPAHADDGYRHGWLRFVEPGVSLERAEATVAEEADANEPFLPGDRIWTNADGRAEFQFPDGALLRLDRRSKLDYSGHEERDGDQVFLRLWSGSAYLRTRARDVEFQIETPGGVLRSV
jgi:ferric-dicitrate binding protein FerR (iron transport regulator)